MSDRETGAAAERIGTVIEGIFGMDQRVLLDESPDGLSQAPTTKQRVSSWANRRGNFTRNATATCSNILWEGRDKQLRFAQGRAYAQVLLQSCNTC